MRASILRAIAPIEINPLELVELSAPQPGDDQVLIKVSACGVCRTDLHVIEGELPNATCRSFPAIRLWAAFSESAQTPYT